MISSSICADALLNAIDKKDQKMVMRIIEQKEYNPALYFEYLTAAQDSLTSARDEFIVQNIKPKSTPFFTTAAILFALWQSYEASSIIINYNTKIYLNPLQLNILNKAWNQIYIAGIGSAILFGMGINSVDKEKEAQLKNAETIYKIMIRCRDLFHMLYLKNISAPTHNVIPTPIQN